MKSKNNDLLFKEVFVICGEEDTEFCELFIGNWQETVENLQSMSPEIDYDVRVFHGVLIPYTNIPSNFRNRGVFLVYQNKMLGHVTEASSTTPEELKKEIGLIEAAENTNIYLLFGYQLETGLCINEEDIDEEIIYSCEQIAKEIKNGQEEIMKYKNTRINVYDETNSETIYDGRLIGLLSEKEYAFISGNEKELRKLFTVETVLCKDVVAMGIGKNKALLTGFRLALVVKKKNNKITNRKKIFISAPLHMISSVKEDNKSFKLDITAKDSYYMLSEA